MIRQKLFMIAGNDEGGAVIYYVLRRMIKAYPVITKVDKKIWIILSIKVHSLRKNKEGYEFNYSECWMLSDAYREEL